MSASSHLQDLPPRVCEAVANYLAFRSTTPSSRTRVASCGNGRALLPLLSVNRHWRSVALDCISSWCSATSHADGRCAVGFPLNPCPDVLTVQPPPDLTQTRLTIDCSLLASESAAGVLAAHAEGYALVANAEHLVLVLVDEQRALLDADMNPSAVEAMSGVIQRLGRIAQTIDVLFGDSDHPMDWETLGRLNSALAPDAAAVGARRLCTLRAYTAIAAEPDELPTGLAGISLALTEGKSQVMEFLHANAATLERLEIAVTDATKLYRLLANAVDEPVLYPELRTLILSPRGDPLEYAMIKRPSADYCPKLRYLDVGVLCPFDISLLLQSGYESLEYIGIHGDTCSLDDMRRLYESHRSRSSRLRDVVIRWPDPGTNRQVRRSGQQQVCNSRERLASGLILKIASNVERIEIGDHSYGRGIPMLFSDPGVMLGNLTTIVARDSAIETRHLAALLRSAPRLERLACWSVEMSPDLESVDSAKRPRFVRREYFPHVGSLVKLEMARRSLEATKIAPLVLMVRLMCPGLSHVGVPENLVTGCRERLKEEREAVQYRVYHRELANIHFVATK